MSKPSAYHIPNIIPNHIEKVNHLKRKSPIPTSHRDKTLSIIIYTITPEPHASKPHRP